MKIPNPRISISRTLLYAALLSFLVLSPFVRGADTVAQGFKPTKLRSEYLQLPVSELLPMLDWMESSLLRTAEAERAKAGLSVPKVPPLVIHSLLLRGKDEKALALIKTARMATDKPLQRPMQFFVEELLARAHAEQWNEQRLTAEVTERLARMPWPAARARLKELIHPLDIPPFAHTLAIAAHSDIAYRFIASKSTDQFVHDIVATRFSGEVLGPRANTLRTAIQAKLAEASSGPSYWQQRAYPPLSDQGAPVSVAVWEPEGVDMALFKHPKDACLVFGKGADCVIEPHIPGANRAQAWSMVQGFHDVARGHATPHAKYWRDTQAQLGARAIKLSVDGQLREHVPQAAMEMGYVVGEVAAAQNRPHGTHVAGIATDGNPFAQLLAIRDGQTLATHSEPDATARKDRFERIAHFLKKNHVRIVNMSWGIPVEKIPTAHALALEQSMLALMRALPDTLFVAAAGNDDRTITTQRIFPASLSAENLLSVGAVDQDGQLTHFSNIGGPVALYANGDMVRSVAPGGHRLEISGTSMAAPHVCNVAAKLLSQHPGLSVAQLKRLLLDGADVLEADKQIAEPIKVLNPANSAALAKRLVVACRQC